jgi:hypothetical protein
MSLEMMSLYDSVPADSTTNSSRSTYTMSSLIGLCDCDTYHECLPNGKLPVHHAWGELDAPVCEGSEEYPYSYIAHCPTCEVEAEVIRAEGRLPYHEGKHNVTCEGSQRPVQFVVGVSSSIVRYRPGVL